MADFFKSSTTSPPPSPADVSARKEAVMAQVRQQLAVASAQELMSKITEKCYMKCVTKPSTSLSSSEETCLARCMDRYMEAFNLVSRAYSTRLSKERLAESEKL